MAPVLLRADRDGRAPGSSAPSTTPSLQIENERFFEFVAHALLNTGTTWLLYIALEPCVRRYTPGILISWTRVLSRARSSIRASGATS